MRKSQRSSKPIILGVLVLAVLGLVVRLMTHQPPAPQQLLEQEIQLPASTMQATAGAPVATSTAAPAP